MKNFMCMIHHMCLIFLSEKPVRFISRVFAIHYSSCIVDPLDCHLLCYSDLTFKNGKIEFLMVNLVMQVICPLHCVALCIEDCFPKQCPKENFP